MSGPGWGRRGGRGGEGRRVVADPQSFFVVWVVLEFG